MVKFSIAFPVLFCRLMVDSPGLFTQNSGVRFSGAMTIVVLPQQRWKNGGEYGLIWSILNRNN